MSAADDAEHSGDDGRGTGVGLLRRGHLLHHVLRGDRKGPLLLRRGVGAPLLPRVAHDHVLLAVARPPHVRVGEPVVQAEKSPHTHTHALEFHSFGRRS